MLSRLVAWNWQLYGVAPVPLEKHAVPRLDTEPFTMPTLDMEDYTEIEDTEADATVPDRLRFPLRAATFTPAPELFPIRVDTWGEITHDTKTDPPQFLPDDTWLDDWTV